MVHELKDYVGEDRLKFNWYAARKSGYRERRKTPINRDESTNSPQRK